jgi:hypothetical protein
LWERIKERGKTRLITISTKNGTLPNYKENTAGGTRGISARYCRKNTQYSLSSSEIAEMNIARRGNREAGSFFLS